MSFERTTPCGVISGTACQWPGITAYKGIRYATAGRWESPIPVTHWDGVYDATQYGACCYQPRAFYDEAAAPGKAFYYNEFRKGETYTYSEDCLFLNVYTPALRDGGKRPVLCYIHGGGYNNGSGSHPLYDGVDLCHRGDVVVVTVHHQLNAFGYLYRGESGDERLRDAGNVGQLDLTDPLRWVREYAHELGGDEDNVTVFGPSGGGTKIAPPMALSLFHI